MSWGKEVWGDWKDRTGMSGRFHQMVDSYYQQVGNIGLYKTGLVDTLQSINSIFGTSIGTKWATKFSDGTNYRYLVKPALMSTFSANLGNTVKGTNAIKTHNPKDYTSAFYRSGQALYEENNKKATPTDKANYGTKDIYAAHLTAKAGEHVNQDTYAERTNTEGANQLSFSFPDWGYDDFINERAMFQKSLYSGVGEKGWFYFKVFFNFDTQYGLFGGLLNNQEKYWAAGNAAARYLWLSSKLYPQENLNDRIVALHKFASILSFISSNAPWFFKSVKNLNTANVPILTELTKEKSIELEFNPDAIDMRVNTMFDLYKFACFDDIGQKEIIPENLRKFDMTVVVFETPLRYLHTAALSKTQGSFPYKSLNPMRPEGGYDNTMSFKMFHFMNCEFDRTSLGNVIPNSMTNEAPIEIGNGSIKIIYDRVYTHTMNEFMQIMFGSDGIYYNMREIPNLFKPGKRKDEIKITEYDSHGHARLDNTTKEEKFHWGREDGQSAVKAQNSGDTQERRYAALINALKNGYSVSEDAMPEIVDAAEAICHLGLRKFGGSVLGNIAGGGSETGLINEDKFGRRTGYGSPSKYFNFKFRTMYMGRPEGDISKYKGNDGLYEDLKNYYSNLTLWYWGRDKTIQLYDPAKKNPLLTELKDDPSFNHSHLNNPYRF